MCVCMHVCVYSCMYVCVYVCLYRKSLPLLPSCPETPDSSDPLGAASKVAASIGIWHHTLLF